MKKVWLLALAIGAVPCAYSQNSPAPASTNQNLIITSPAASAFDHASLLFAQKDFTGALKEFASIAKLYPNDSRREESLYRVAECYRLLGRQDDAVAAYRFFLQTFPGSPFQATAQYYAGELLTELSRYDEASPLLEQSRHSSNKEIQTASSYYFAVCQLNLKQTDSGRKILSLLLDDSIAATWAPFAAQLLATSYEKENQWPLALTYWQKALSLAETKPLQACASAKGGWAALQSKNEKEAEGLFETCRHLEAQGNWRKLANTGLMRIYFNQKRFNEITDLFNHERNGFLDTARAEILYEAGHSWFIQKKWKDADEILSLFLRDFSQSPWAASAAYERFVARTSLNPADIAGESAAYLAAYPDSPWTSTVKLLRAQDYSSRGKFSQAIPMWEELARKKYPDLPADRIQWELARAYQSCQQWPQAANAFGAFADQFPKHNLALNARMQQAIAWQNLPDPVAAISAWEKVRSIASSKSSEKQTALEQLVLLYSRLNQKQSMTDACQSLLNEFPQSKIRALACYTLGAMAFDSKKDSDAIDYLQQARQADPAAWYLPATERLALAAYRQKKFQPTADYTSEYEAARKDKPDAPMLPVDLYFWLGEQARASQNFAQAIVYFTTVIRQPQNKDFLNAAWWDLAESQRAAHQWKDAISSYQMFQQLSPDMSKTSEVLLALAQSHLGAEELDPAQKEVETVMLQEPEGLHNAQARLILGNIYRARHDDASAAKVFSALSLLYNDPVITPEAMSRAIACYEKTGDVQQAAEWRAKLKKNYPGYAPQ